MQNWRNKDSKAINNIPMVATESQMVDVDCPTLCEVDKQVARDVLMSIIAFFSKSLNQQRAMLPEQIKVMACDMVDEFPNDSFIFVKLFFKKLRSGALGNIYGTVDELTILDRYRKYRDEVMQKYPMRKIPPKIPKDKDVKALTEHDERIGMPGWFQEKYGVHNESDDTKQKDTISVNPSHEQYEIRLNNAKTQEERINIMAEYLKS